MTNWTRRKGTSKSRTVIVVLIMIMAGTSLFNIMFMLHTTSQLTDEDKEPAEYDFQFHKQSFVPPAVHWIKEKSSSSNTGNRYLKIEVLSSKDNVTVTLDGNLHLDTSEMLIRGMNVLVLNEVTGAVMSSRWFDTYESQDDSSFLMEYLQGLKLGRILCFAIKDEASFHLSDNVRIFIKSLGSSYVSQIKWRSMWTFVVQRLNSHSIVYGEGIQHVSEHEKWGAPVHLHTMVKLLPEVHIKCDWDDSPANKRRREFCDKYEGYSHVCSCDNPLSLDFNPPPFQDGSRLKLPVAVMASNRPSYLLRMLLSLRTVEGLDTGLVTVFIDGFFDEPASVAKLFGLNVEQHAGAGRLNSRISQHYKKSLTSSFARHPDANYLVILEEDLYMSVDILSFFKQLLPVLENDKSVYCISAWNDQGYDHLCNDPAMMYRVETMPGLGWVLSRKLYKGELEAKWPKPEQPNDWDMWMRMESNKKGRECIIPDISRTYHFGAKGLNVGSFMQTIYFKKKQVQRPFFLQHIISSSFDKRRLDENLTIKEVFKWIYGPTMEELLQVNYKPLGPFKISIVFTHKDSEKELEFLRSESSKSRPRQRRKRQRVEDNPAEGMLTGAAVRKALKELTTVNQLKRLTDCPPKLSHSPSELSEVTCSHDSIYIAGRYNKFSRVLSQTPWIIDNVRHCESSVEEKICDRIRGKINAEGHKFASAGREDVDVRMLGRGRPFLVEFINPRVTRLSESFFSDLQHEINSSTTDISVRDLQQVTKEECLVLKDAETNKTKTYKALIWTEKEVTDEQLHKLNDTKDLMISQKTPLRVLHRRPLAARERCIYTMTPAERIDAHHFNLLLKTQAGTSR